MSRFNTTPGGANSGGNDMVEPQLRTAMMMQSSSASTRSSDYRNHQFPPTTSSMMTNADFGMSAAGYGGQDTSGFRAYDDPSSFGAHHHPHHPQFQQQPTSPPMPYNFTTSPPPRANSTPLTSHMATQQSKDVQDYNNLVFGMGTLGLNDHVSTYLVFFLYHIYLYLFKVPNEQPKINRMTPQQQQRYMQWMNRQGGGGSGGGVKPPPQSLDAMLNDGWPNQTSGVMSPGKKKDQTCFRLFDTYLYFSELSI